MPAHHGFQPFLKNKQNSNPPKQVFENMPQGPTVDDIYIYKYNMYKYIRIIEPIANDKNK